jgi:hypothetical protein
VLAELTDADRANEMTHACRAWAARFSWERSAELLAGVLLAEIGTGAERADRRAARADLGTVARFRSRADGDLGAGELAAGLRATDQIIDDGTWTSVLLGGCDEVDADALLRRHGVIDATVRLIDRYDLLTGPDRGGPGRPVLRSAAGSP